jgi:hypothetical protein
MEDKEGWPEVKELYLSWDTSPLFQLLEFRRGPFLLLEFPGTNIALWLVLTLLAWILIALVTVLLFRHARRKESLADRTRLVTGRSDSRVNT